MDDLDTVLFNLNALRGIETDTLKIEWIDQSIDLIKGVLNEYCEGEYDIEDEDE